MTRPVLSARSPIRPASRRRAVGLLGATLLAAFGFMLGTAGPVVACSCAMPTSLAEQATAEHAIFAGTADVLQARGVPVVVERWFWGAGAAPVVWLTADSFGDDGASCRTSPPPPGSQWIWVTWLPGNQGDFGAGLCSPAGNLATPEGQAMFEEAVATFVGVAIPSAEPDPTAAPAASPSTAPADQTGLLVGLAIAIASLALFGAIVLVARRRSA
ncbi:MAG TPA: hypothetical protein VFO73_15930 [Candidatus Limnocylindrales bacterium]|nr:hypothetical protein [Candidatus Limnocylindrales bacterium]